MSDSTVKGSSHMHFSGSNDGYVYFGGTEPPFARLLTQLYVHTTGEVSISFDGGEHHMTLAAGDHIFPHPCINKVHFGGTGTWEGVGISV